MMLWGGGLKAQANFTANSVQTFSLGGATTGSLHGLSAVSQNPASLGTVSTTQVQTQAGTYFEGSATALRIAAAQPINSSSSWSVQLPIYTISSIPHTTIGSNNKAQQLGTFSDTEVKVLASYAKHFYRLNTTVGVTAGALYHSIHTESAYGANLAIGALTEHRNGSTGLAIRNIPLVSKTWTTGHSEESELQIALGTAYDILTNGQVLADISYDTEVELNAGVSVDIKQELTLMGGVNNVTNSPQARVGARLAVGSFIVDYGAAFHNDLGMVHKVGLQFEI